MKGTIEKLSGATTEVEAKKGMVIEDFLKAGKVFDNSRYFYSLRQAGKEDELLTDKQLRSQTVKESDHIVLLPKVVGGNVCDYVYCW